MLAWIEPHLRQKGVDDAQVVARWLVARALGVDPIHLYTDLDRPVTPEERGLLRDLVKRAAAHEPVQYLLGEAGFLGRPFQVGPGVLVPRTTTETLVNLVLTWHRGLEPDDRPETLDIVDVGTGSGCIAVSLALHIEGVRVKAVDVDEQALAWARRNVEAHGVSDRVSLLKGDLLAPVDAPVHVVVSNPPYISDARFENMAPVVRDHEPHAALRAGSDGLDVIRRVLDQAGPVLCAGGLLVVECDDHHAGDVLALAHGHGTWADARIVRDEFGDDRFLVATRSPR